MKKKISGLLPKEIRIKLAKLTNNFLVDFAFKSYSQEGEDMILRRIFAKQQKGFYVDVGAHHPKRFSNTFNFYKKGWRGINIDAMPGSMKLFRRVRPNDINLEIPISNNGQILTYYVFNEPALNGFSKEISYARQNEKNKFYIQKEIRLQTFSLSEILEKNLPGNIKIDFLSIDVEGFDFDVLKSNDWEKFKPTVVLVEIFGKNLSEIIENEISLYLGSLGYSIYAKTINTVVFIHDNALAVDKF